ncbi:unnamed protein product [Strongylus vulgaris]|uniref:Uncharacterized protein n=1 Tax=Strongylus vulgaris TaxID=40348 RepID=A0A3P7IT71_STRVU|nr:unnamed protein product [Strongylus vulgaris]
MLADNYFLRSTSQNAEISNQAVFWELCPPGLQPLTGIRHVRTCDDSCPRGSTCVQGICCTRQPSCNHFTYK